ncbi:MAG: branched-chain amino acid transaminase [Candidatus Melainabacteria bacterium]|nr:branched-chain amino acid transaminase [Candidatus Melainabacteria bacterium]
MNELVFFEGQFVPLDDAKVSVKTHAFMYGTSLFEGIRGYWVPERNEISIFRLKEHYERLLSNCRIFHMDLGYTLQELMDITVELVQKNNPDYDTYIRPMAYKADVEKIGFSLLNTESRFLVWTHPLGNYVDIERGLSVCVSNWRRLEDSMIPPRAKAGGAYVNSALAVTDARKAGFDDAIVLTERGTVSEGTGMNLFMVKNGRLVTPATTENILEGITRDTIATLARQELGIETQERVVHRTELYTADELFFCGTGAQVAPITQVDHRPVGSGAIGPISRKIQDLYFRVVKGHVPGYSHWCTPVSVGAAAVR